MMSISKQNALFFMYEEVIVPFRSVFQFQVAILHFFSLRQQFHIFQFEAVIVQLRSIFCYLSLFFFILHINVDIKLCNGREMDSNKHLNAIVK